MTATAAERLMLTEDVLRQAIAELPTIEDRQSRFLKLADIARLSDECRDLKESNRVDAEEIMLTGSYSLVHYGSIIGTAENTDEAEALVIAMLHADDGLDRVTVHFSGHEDEDSIGGGFKRMVEPSAGRVYFAWKTGG